MIESFFQIPICKWPGCVNSVHLLRKVDLGLIRVQANDKIFCQNISISKNLNVKNVIHQDANGSLVNKYIYVN